MADLNLFSTNITTNNVLRSSGRSRRVNDVNILEIFYNLYNKPPYIFSFGDIMDGYYFKWNLLMEELYLQYPDLNIVFQDETKSLKKNMHYFSQQTVILRDGLIMHIEGGLYSNFVDMDETDDDFNIVERCYFLIDNESIDDELLIEEKEILSTILLSTKTDDPETIYIGMVSFEDGEFYVKKFDIKDNILDMNEDLFDLHYGDGFSEFNNKYKERLLTYTKGLTLFYGDPGTGKTTYLRYIIKEIITASKFNNILYFPPTMVDSITEPTFLNFMSEWVSDNSGKTYLLIEDAEPLLESRNQGRNLGITNLLNLTDGILNDVLNLQIIATFNTKLTNIDTALLRSGRLVARKEFKNLPKEYSLELARYLGIDEKLIKDKMTLADIYSLKNETLPLTHDVDGNPNRISF